MKKIFITLIFLSACSAEKHIDCAIMHKGLPILVVEDKYWYRPSEVCHKFANMLKQASEAEKFEVFGSDPDQELVCTCYEAGKNFN